MISPHVPSEFFSLTKELEWIEDRWNSRYLEDTAYFLIVAATPNKEVNREIADYCKKNNILVNVASEAALCDFYFPAVVFQENCVIGITGTGENHQEVKQLRKKIEELSAYVENRKQRKQISGDSE